jgi:hypothetical protein
MSKHEYTTVEVLCNITETEMGNVVEPQIAARGTLLATARKQPRLIIAKMTKRCLANHVPGLREATTIVHIPDVDMHGKQLDRAQWEQAFWFACDKYGVPLWTQSSIKHNTFYFIERPMFDRLTSKWNLAEDGPKFAAYIGLLFSETDECEPMRFTLKSVCPAPDGKDGSCNVGAEWWPFAGTKQIRGMILPQDGIPEGYIKGIVVPVEGDFEPELNNNQVKYGVAGAVVMLTNDEEPGYTRKMWASAEISVFLKDNKEVRNFAAGRVRRIVRDYLNDLTEDGIPRLLKRLGGLKLNTAGELADSLRAVIDALRANIPWCREIEERVTRFAIREICEHIIPSLGIEAWFSTMVISDEFGVQACALEDARCFAFRIPVTGANAIIPLPKNPYVRGKGMVVHSSVAKLASGDDDNDKLNLVTDREAVELIKRNLDTRIVSGMKPEKSKAKHELTPRFMEDAAINQVSNAWMVGALTIAGWKMIQAGDVDMASKMLDLANIEPMTYKHSVVIDGQPFAEYASGKYGQIREELKAITLHWRDRGVESAGWSSIRQLASSEITDPASHLDWAWNAAVDAAKSWAAKNELRPLSLSAVSRVAFAERRIALGGSDLRAARGIIAEWGEYWAEIRRNKALQGDHSRIYKRACEWGKTASPTEIAALLVWRPMNPESTGFSLKWHAVFAAGRGAEVLGLRPSVAEAVKQLRHQQADLQMQEALIDAVLEAVEANTK